MYSNDALIKTFSLKMLLEMNNYMEMQRSNRKAQDQTKSKFAGSVYQAFTLKELYHVHGILLRIGLTKAHGGDYAQYFGENYKYIQSRDKQQYLRLGFEPWAKKYMTLRRFKQFLCVFCHQSKKPAVADKCYQLRMVCNTISAAAKKNFRPEQHNSFDEGGVGCRSCRCLTHQYNTKDKPKKFHVDFFILSDADDYPILHVDPYEGKGSSMSGVSEMAKKTLQHNMLS
jgi:hypothetical protein